jgi:hypothetical protein
MNETGMAVFGDELREFVTRDLFIKAKAPRFDGAVFFAELEETLTELRRIFLNAALALRKTTGKSKKKSKLRHIVLHPEEMWLWFRYFLMPAMMDAENIIALTKGVSTIDRVQDGDRNKEPEQMSGVLEYYSGYYKEWHDAEWQSEYSYGIGGAIDIYKRFDPSPMGFTNWDVLRAVWERTPWSFVFDWFINVGDWLASLRTVQIDYAQSYATYAIQAETKWTYPDWLDDSAEWRCKIFLMDRIIDLNQPNTPLVDKRWLNCLRLIDSISLIVATLHRVVSRRK